MGNMATNVYAKSNYDRLRIDEALGFRKSDNKKRKNNNKVKEQIRSDLGVGPFRKFRIQEQ